MMRNLHAYLKVSDVICPETGWQIIRRTDRSTGNVAVLELQLSHTKPYIEEDA